MRYAQIAPLCDGEICYNIANNSFAFIALLARVKPRISTVRAAIRWVRPSGRISFRDFFRGFRGPYSESGRGAPSLTLAGVKSIGGWKVAADDIERDRPACEGE